MYYSFRFLFVCGLSLLSVSLWGESKTLVDFFLPMESRRAGVSEGAWGASNVIPRDTNNGLEDVDLDEWCYWDGSIVKDDEGKYHMYASRWTQSVSHGKGWNTKSLGTHAVSDTLFGPYKDQGLIWPQWRDGEGSNVVGLRMHDGRYAGIASEVVPGQVFVSDDPFGPFELLGDFKIDSNGFYSGWGRYNELDHGAVRAGTVGFLSNVMVILRPDGRYMMIARHCVPMISDNGILGPYKMYGDKAWRGIEGLPQYKMEDPTVWYSDGLYHIVVNFHGEDTSYHLTSRDGMHNWKNRGVAFRRNAGVFRHKDGTVEDWYTVQRPTVYTEEETVKAFNFSVIDVHKGEDRKNDKHGSKIVVIPFDGDAFKQHIKGVVEEEQQMIEATPAPEPWHSLDIGEVAASGNTGYDKVVNTIQVKASGNGLDSDSDAFRYVYQKMSGDVSAKVQILSQDIIQGEAISGLMVRSNLETNSPFVSASISKSEGFTFSKRGKIGRTATVLETADIAAPYWVRVEKRGDLVSSYISTSDRMNWDKIGETKLELGEAFYVGLAVSSGGDKNSGLARFRDVDVHPYGIPLNDGIVRHTFPDEISVSGIVPFEVEIESVQTLDVWVELQNVQTLEKHKVLQKRFWKNGTQKLVYEAGENLDPNATYWFVIKAVPMHYHDSEHVDSGFKKVFVAD